MKGLLVWINKGQANFRVIKMSIGPIIFEKFGAALIQHTNILKLALIITRTKGLDDCITAYLH